MPDYYLTAGSMTPVDINPVIITQVTHRHGDRWGWVSHLGCLHQIDLISS